ncbi:MAG: hypothetical protein K2M00_01655, partial [Muribaculaceae bacterium]|nr:hypothetical protein [Muribaculaceae bacterium]
MNKFTALAIALMTSVAVSAGPAITVGPDFAFPKTVISNADSVLAVSKEPGQRMQALMQKCVAMQSIDPDSAFVLPGIVASYAERESDAAYRGLLKLFQARLLADIYSQKSYAYNRVAAPPEPLPADVALWSGDLFRSETGRLISEASKILAPYGEGSLKNYSSVIETGENTLTFYPMLRDFVASSSISIAESTGLPELRETLRKQLLNQLKPGTAEWVSWVDDSDAAEQYEKYSTGLVGGVLLYKIPKKEGADTALGGLVKNYLETEPENLITDVLK